MTKDFKVADTTTPSQYGISWVLGGIAVGLLLGAAVYALMAPKPASLSAATPANQLATSTANPATPAPQAGTASTVSSLQDKPATTDNRPGFSYHAVLPQLEMTVPITVQEETPDSPKTPSTKPTEEKKVAAKPVPEQKLTAQTNAESPAEKAPASAQGRIMYQLGSYKTEAQASQIQRLASQKGLSTRVEVTDIKGERWYRVRLGPTNDANVASRWKQMLSGMGISAMEIRL